MGDQFLISLPEEGDKENEPDPPLSYTEIFENHFPYYLAIGMTPDEYWNGDNQLPKAFREADKIRMKRMNHEKWLQGAYIYEAICAASPLINFSKRSKAYPYMKTPFETEKPVSKKSKIEQEKEEMQRNIEKFERMMIRVNAKFARKEGEGDG